MHQNDVCRRWYWAIMALICYRDSISKQVEITKISYSTLLTSNCDSSLLYLFVVLFRHTMHITVHAWVTEQHVANITYGARLVSITPI
jgi:hypothetical protein